MPVSKLHDEECEFALQTQKAWGCDCGKEDKDGNAVLTWFPKSQCEIDPRDPDPGDTVTITMPLYIAKEKGLI